MILKVSTPCPMSWESLKGNDRVRFCGRCNLKVYNVEALDRAEVQALIRTSEGGWCARLFLRGDQTATVRDCPRGKARRFLKLSLVAASAVLLALYSWISRTQIQVARRDLPRPVQRVLEWVDPLPEREYTVGRICPPQIPPQGASGSSTTLPQ